MPHETDLCIHLLSELSPCPWLRHIPQLKYARERLEGHLDDHCQSTCRRPLNCVSDGGIMRQWQCTRGVIDALGIVQEMSEVEQDQSLV